jgi:hypothetical protein
MPKETKMLTIRIPGALHQKIKVQCAVDDVKMSDVVRRLLEQEYASPGKGRATAKAKAA